MCAQCLSPLIPEAAKSIHFDFQSYQCPCGFVNTHESLTLSSFILDFNRGNYTSDSDHSLLPSLFVNRVGKLPFIKTWKELVTLFGDAIKQEALEHAAKKKRIFTRDRLKANVNAIFKNARTNISSYSLDLVRGMGYICDILFLLPHLSYLS